MLEKLGMGFGVGFEWFFICFIIFASTALFVEIMIVLKRVWQERDSRFKGARTKWKIVITFFWVMLFMAMSYLGYTGIKNSDTIIERYNDIKQNPSNVAKYYKFKQKGDLLYFDLKREYRGSWVLQEHTKTKIIKEKPESYQVEYQGEYFEVKKGGIENVRKID